LSNAAAMADLRKRIANVRASAREPGARHLSDAPNLSPATMRVLAARKPRRA
jgi:hypothetical protein